MEKLKKLPLRKCPSCNGKLIPKMGSIRRAHEEPGARTCWMYDAICNGCGRKVIEEMHGIDRPTLIRILRGR